MRTDLNMRKGKMIAQGAHASMKVFFDKMSTEENELPVFQLDEQQKKCSGYIMTPLIKKQLLFGKNDPMLEWMEGSFAKIVVGVDSLESLLSLQKQAEEVGIINAIITDNGNTEFKETCLDCEGKGSFHNGYGMPIECKNCNGTGKVNKPTITCLAIGPDLSERIDLITKELKPL
jgi:PTH2 family peptidyl-tRNA hydrolase